jgi:hypothetical protein
MAGCKKLNTRALYLEQFTKYSLGNLTENKTEGRHVAHIEKMGCRENIKLENPKQ